MTIRGLVARTVGRATGDDSGATDVGLTLLAAAIAAVLVLPLFWLAVDAVGLGDQALELAVAPQTLEVLVRSVALVAIVTGASVLVGVPLAVITVQGSIPFPRFWTVLAALPLAVPSYLGAFAFVSAFRPQGEFADLLAPLGIESIPSVYGFAGAAFVLTLYTYPYVFLTTRASLLSLDGSLVEAARTLNTGRWTAFSPSHPPADPSRDHCRCITRGTVRLCGLRHAQHHARRGVYAVHLCPVQRLRP